MASVWFHSALWLGLAFLASLISIRVAISVALIEIVLGAVAGNLVGLQITDWVNFLAGFGAILLTFLAEHELPHRMRIIAFSILTPFYFLKAGSLVEAHAVAQSVVLISIFLAIKMATKFIGILPLTVYHEFDRREGMYTTLLMSTGLTFGSISALFGLSNRIIDQTQYTILVTAVIGSAVIPTLIAQRWFQPELKTLEPDAIEAEAVAGEGP